MLLWHLRGSKHHILRGQASPVGQGTSLLVTHGGPSVAAWPWAWAAHAVIRPVCPPRQTILRNIRTHLSHA
jgi:hypothetical protein